MFVVCWLSFLVVCCLLRYLMCVACDVLIVVWCLMDRCGLFVVCRLLFGDPLELFDV